MCEDENNGSTEASLYTIAMSLVMMGPIRCAVNSSLSKPIVVASLDRYERSAA